MKVQESRVEWCLGGDWQIIRADGFTDIDARYTLETDEGQLIYVSNIGIRHAPPEIIRRLNAGEAVDQSQIYFRTVPRFETGAPDLEWLMQSIFIATALSQWRGNPLLAGALG